MMKRKKTVFHGIGCFAFVCLSASAITAFGVEQVTKSTPAVTGGQKQVEEYFAQHKELLSTASLPVTEEAKKANEEFDALCGQKDCAFSRLYWYRDLDAAKAEAKRLHRPILALHLLGKLTDEYSCANSRFFRAIYYSNPDIANYLKENYVLYWKTVREVPQVTVKFADGREFHQTITGNSIHYMLSDSGQVIDALPGLSTPDSFGSELRKFIEKAPWKEQDATQANIRNFHAARLKEIEARTGNSVKAVLEKREQEQIQLGESSRAMAAARLSMSKSIMEVPLYKALGRSLRELKEALPGQNMKTAFGTMETLLHPDSLHFIKLHNPNLTRLAREKFAETLILDQVENENEQRVIISSWLSVPTPLTDLNELNKRVYAYLFRTPDSDPWLGLNPDDAYSGLLNSGIKK